MLLVFAISFVAVTVIRKPDQEFEAKPVNRPRMQLKKLQVPVNIKKKTQKPKLRKRIVVKPRFNQTLPDIKMPEVTGIKGGMGSGADSGLDVAGGVGFSMPEIEIFGVKSRGEKVLFILDASPEMMYDEMGGIPAYTIIKSELLRIVGSIGSQTLFNLIVVDGNSSRMLFPQMTSASPDNVQRMEEWIEPLNAVSKGMGDRDYGLRTIGSGGKDTGSRMEAGKITRQRTWLHPAMVAQKLQADTIFLLTNNWDAQTKVVEGTRREAGSGRDRLVQEWEEYYRKAKKLLDKENEERMKRGEPPRALAGKADIIHAYFPDAKSPPRLDEIYGYTPRDIAEAFEIIRERYARKDANDEAGRQLLSLYKKKKNNFSFNVIHFRPVNDSGAGGGSENFRVLTRICDGEYNTIAGLDAIRSYVSAGDLE